MSDEDDKKPRRGAAGDSPRPRGKGGPGGKSFGGKSFGSRGEKPAFGYKKPFAKRADGKPAYAGGPKRDFQRSERPVADGDRPKRDFRKDDSRAERPKRDFSRRVDTPASDRPPRKEFGERKPYVKREGGAPRPGRYERSARADNDAVRSEGGERPPRREFRERSGAGGGSYAKKPYGGGEGASRKPFDKAKGDFGPKRDFGAKRDFGSRPEQGEKRDFGHGRDRGPKRDFEPRRDERPKRDFGPKKDFAPKKDFSDRKSSGGFKPRPRPSEAAEESGERIAKRLARAGIASRRDAEELIAAGRIKVNGKVLASPAFNVSAADVIHLDDTEIPAIERTRLFLFHKPAGLVTTNRDPEGRKTVFDVLPADLPRLMTIGRLDINTEGLLLLTNDGGLSRVLELPATGWLRRYRVRVHGKVDEKALAGLREGIAVDGVFYGAIEATLERTQGTNAWLTIGLREGKNREVKNILGALGLEVTRLIRISYGPFQLGELPEGHVLEIKGRMLRDQLGERLVEESGANFDAEISKPFSNKPVRRTESRSDEGDRPKFTRDGDRRPIGEGGLIKNRKRRENSRDEALGKLSTRPDRPKFERGDKPVGRFEDRAGKPGGRFEGRGGKPDGKKGAREQKPIDPPGQRRANVWMAPGARPQTRNADADASSKPSSRDEGRSGERRPRQKGPAKGPKSR